MKTGLLQAVRKYRPREGMDPLENFVTEAFCWVLNNNRELGSKFAAQIADKSQFTGFSVTDCNWTTQYNFNGVFPDMVCVSNNKAIVFEHKVWSEVHSGQISKYRSYAAEHFCESKIVLVTANKHQHIISEISNQPDLSMCWQEVYEFVGEFEAGSGDDYCPVSDFRGLLRSEGLGPAAPVSHQAIRYHFATNKLKRDISNLVARVEKKDWSLLQQTGLTREEGKKKPGHEYAEAWGRIGMYFKGGRPDLFVGFIIDPDDLYTPAMDESKGPDMSLIFGFNKKTLRQYSSSPNYKELIETLKVKVPQKMGAGWQLYLHHEDNSVDKKHKGVPVHIRKPMLDVFSGSSSAAEQEETFFETANALIMLITDEPCFWRLREELQELEDKRAA